MKFFTDEKYEQGLSHIEYEAYCRSIWEILPNDLKRIQNGMVPNDLLEGLISIGLHDARIVKFTVSDDIVKIVFDTDNNCALRKVFLEYNSATILKRPNENVLGADIENPNSDIMCHEIEILQNQGFLHSLLFASNEEFIIGFKSISLSHKDYE